LRPLFQCIVLLCTLMTSDALGTVSVVAQFETNFAKRGPLSRRPRFPHLGYHLIFLQVLLIAQEVT
jgi:hypothetical protein